MRHRLVSVRLIVHLLTEAYLTCYWIWYQYEPVKPDATDMNEHWQDHLTTSSTLDRGALVFNSMHHIAIKLASNIAEKTPYVLWLWQTQYHFCNFNTPNPQNPPSPLSLLFLGVAWHLPNTWPVINPSCARSRMSSISKVLD